MTTQINELQVLFNQRQELINQHICKLGTKRHFWLAYKPEVEENAFNIAIKQIDDVIESLIGYEQEERELSRIDVMGIVNDVVKEMKEDESHKIILEN